MSKTFKNIIIFVIIAAAVALGYIFFFSKSDTPLTPTTTSGLQSSSATGGTVPVTGIVQQESQSVANASQISQEFINQLLNLKAIKLNDEIFSSLAFQSLEDFTIVLIQPGNEGRPNPFAPFGIDTDTVPPPAPTSTIEVIPVTPTNTPLGNNNS